MACWNRVRRVGVCHSQINLLQNYMHGCDVGVADCHSWGVYVDGAQSNDQKYSSYAIHT
jgi:hypothetical protein